MPGLPSMLNKIFMSAQSGYNAVNKFQMEEQFSQS